MKKASKQRKHAQLMRQLISEMNEGLESSLMRMKDSDLLQAKNITVDGGYGLTLVLSIKPNKFKKNADRN